MQAISQKQKVPRELTDSLVKERIEKLYKNLCAEEQEWDIAVIVGRVNQYYYTGTFQDGIFILKNDGSYAHFVRKSYLRALDECLIEELFPMKSYRDAQAFVGKAETIFIDKEVATMTVLERLQKSFQTEQFLGLDKIIQTQRAVKDDYELSCVRQAGLMHEKMLNDILPTLLEEGMDEAELTARLYYEMVKLGHQGVTRFHMFQEEQLIGQLGFGDNSIYPSSFDGPGGMRGMSAIVPSIGDRKRKLTPGDVVFIDIGFGYQGYHSDRTQIYRYKAEPDELMVEAHTACMKIQKEAAALLKPGIKASTVYEETVGKLPPQFKENFMGLGNETVKFLGHGVGLEIDEFPVITPRFDMVLEKNMVIALEPKKSLPGIGIVGVEDTYVVSEEGGICLTGGQREIMSVW